LAASDGSGCVEMDPIASFGVAVVISMHCPICNATAGFLATEYVMPFRNRTLRAPALECVDCGAIVLDEITARTDQELESLQQALTLRRVLVRQRDHRHGSRSIQEHARLGGAHQVKRSVLCTSERGIERWQAFALSTSMWVVSEKANCLSN
jgi:hypothetical protein